MDLRKGLIIPALTLLSLSSAFSAEAIKKEVPIKKPVQKVVVTTAIKNAAVKPGPGVGADEHGCIAPGIWHEPSKSCVTDILPSGGATQDGMQTE